MDDGALIVKSLVSPLIPISKFEYFFDFFASRVVTVIFPNKNEKIIFIHAVILVHFKIFQNTIG